jgi:MFS family permease
MTLPLDSTAITHSIQLAVAPVFLLTAVSGMIGAVAGRLARIIDRGRQLEEKARQGGDDEFLQRANKEMRDLRKRGRLANLCIALLTTCGFLIGLTIVVLFVGELTDLTVTRMAVGSFLAGIICFLLALFSFLVETIIATRTLNFRLPAKR